MQQKVSSLLYFILALYQVLWHLWVHKKYSTAVASLRERTSQVLRFPQEAAAQNYVPALPTKYMKEAVCLRIAGGETKKQHEQLG